MAVLISIILTPFLLIAAGLFGYFTGVIIALIPFFNDLFTVGLGLRHGAIPTIMAWLFVLTVLNALYSKGDKD